MEGRSESYWKVPTQIARLFVKGFAIRMDQRSDTKVLRTLVLRFQVSTKLEDVQKWDSIGIRLGEDQDQWNVPRPVRVQLCYGRAIIRNAHHGDPSPRHQELDFGHARHQVIRWRNEQNTSSSSSWCSDWWLSAWKQQRCEIFFRSQRLFSCLVGYQEDGTLSGRRQSTTPQNRASSHLFITRAFFSTFNVLAKNRRLFTANHLRDSVSFFTVAVLRSFFFFSK